MSLLLAGNDTVPMTELCALLGVVEFKVIRSVYKQRQSVKPVCEILFHASEGQLLQVLSAVAPLRVR